MARNWDALGASSRARYERAGIGRSAYESGASLKAARGHGQTPERPAEALRRPERFERYLSIRREILDLKKELYGPNAKANIKSGTSSASLEKRAEILRAKIDYNGSWDEFWDDYPEWDRDDYADVEYYH